MQTLSFGLVVLRAFMRLSGSFRRSDSVATTLGSTMPDRHQGLIDCHQQRMFLPQSPRSKLLAM
jgi:hypothetical protein